MFEIIDGKNTLVSVEVGEWYQFMPYINEPNPPVFRVLKIDTKDYRKSDYEGNSAILTIEVYVLNSNSPDYDWRRGIDRMTIPSSYILRQITDESEIALIIMGSS